MALGDKVEELQRTVAALVERVENALKAIEGLEEDHRRLARELADLRRDHDREIALLKREVEGLQKWKDEDKKDREERSRRAWSLAPNVVGAMVSGAIAAAVAYFISRR